MQPFVDKKSLTVLPSKNFNIDRRSYKFNNNTDFKFEGEESEDENCEVFVEPGYFPCDCNVCKMESKPGPKNHKLKKVPAKLELSKQIK